MKLKFKLPKSFKLSYQSGKAARKIAPHVSKEFRKINRSEVPSAPFSRRAAYKAGYHQKELIGGTAAVGTLGAAGAVLKHRSNKRKKQKNNYTPVRRVSSQ